MRRPLFTLVSCVLLAVPGIAAQEVEDAPALSWITVDADGDFVPDRVGRTVAGRGFANMAPRRARGDSIGSWFFVTVEDGEGGLRLLTRDRSMLHGVDVGDEVAFSGALTHRRGAEEVVLQSLRATGESRPIVPLDALVREVRGEPLMHRLVRVEGTLGPFDEENETVELTDRSGSIPIRVTQRLIEDVKLANDLVEGHRATVVGIVGQADRRAPFDEAYRVAPREAVDIVVVAPPPILEWVVIGLLALALATIAVTQAWGRRATERADELETLTAALERSRSELEKSAAESEALFEDESAARFVVDPTGRLTRWNAALLALVGGSDVDLDSVKLHDLVDEGSEDGIVIEGERGTRQVEVRLRLGGDAERIGLLSSTPIQREDGEWRHCSLIDVTRRMRLEDQLVRSQKMEALGRLAGGVAHDINNMLAIILGNTELMRDEGPHDAETETSLDEIQSAAVRSGRMARQLLTMARRDVAQTEPVDVTRLIGEMQPMLRRVVGDDGWLRMALDSDVPAVLADVGQLEQVVLNLVTNGSDATDGTGCVEIGVSENAEGDVVLRVSDDGSGIAEHDLERIFEPFYSTKPEGSGLGLATVYGIVTSAGGTIQVRSAPQAGTTFTVTLPGVGAPPERRPDRAEAEAGDFLLGWSVLLAEDEDGVRLATGRFLETLGCTVHEAVDGAAALERVSEDPRAFDVLLTDVMMPGLDGGSLADAAKRLRPDLPIVFMSGYVDASEALGSDASPHFLQKPFTHDELVSKLRRAVSEAQGRRGLITPSTGTAQP